MPEHTDAAPPTLQLIRGDTTPEEVAAIVAVLTAVGGGEEASVRTRHTGVWADPSRLVRQAVHPGPGGWAASGLPH